jgi:hypothetical protein
LSPRPRVSASAGFEKGTRSWQIRHSRTAGSTARLDRKDSVDRAIEICRTAAAHGLNGLIIPDNSLARIHKMTPLLFENVERLKAECRRLKIDIIPQQPVEECILPASGRAGRLPRRENSASPP